MSPHLIYLSQANLLDYDLHFYRADTQRIFVDVGLGFHVEFTWSEALKFISLKEERLAR